MATNKFTDKRYDDFSGGDNYYFGSRQINDNESPDSVNCDFLGKSGVGNRQGYSQIGAVTNSRTKIYGLDEFHSSSADQILKFAGNGTNTKMYYSTGDSWSESSETFANTDMDGVQAGGYFYTANGSDVMKKWDGTAWSSVVNGTIGVHPEYYDKRLWVVDTTDKGLLKFSGQWSTTSKLGDFTDSSAGTITFRPGSGAEIRGIKSFKNALYVWLYPFGVYSVSPATAENTFNISLITNAVGCVSHRSIAQVGEDIFFASDDGVYSLGDVANYSGVVRSTNRSSKIQRVFNNMTGINKTKLVGEYFNFKYHLYYSLFGSNNDSCMAYDVRYKSWQDWRNMSANDATLFTDSDYNSYFVFGESDTGKVQKMYSGSTDDGTPISSYWFSKSFDEKIPERMKLYFDTTFLFGQLNGTVNVSVIFNDTEVSTTKSISQLKPQGGFGRDCYGRNPFGRSSNTIVNITSLVGVPLRMKAKGQKFAIQYKISSTGQWRLDNITQLLQVFDHFKFVSQYKLN